MMRSPRSVVLSILDSHAHAGSGIGTNQHDRGPFRDASGGVLPGVTVEVSSPALIENAFGRHRRLGRVSIVAFVRHLHGHLHPSGLQHRKRENVELTSDFTATINADLKVGALEERLRSPASRRSSTRRASRSAP